MAYATPSTSECAVSLVSSSSPVLEVDDLRMHFFTDSGIIRAVDGVSLRVGRGETLGLVGESGCGKTMLALSILRLVPEPGRIESGRVLVDGRDVLAMDGEMLRRLRGGYMALTLQDPMTSLNPVITIKAQIKEAMTAHDRFPHNEAGQRVVPLMEKVGIPDASHRAGDYPHQFSGGMRQRVLIAMGIANQPALLIADEATSALDATAQAHMVTLLRRLNEDLGAAVVLITHNMGLVAGLCQRVAVMYAGQIVEEGPTDKVFARPLHPYTWHLLRSVPRVEGPRHRRLVVVGGHPPDPSQPPKACRFHPRCAFREDRCLQEEPSLVESEPLHLGRCFVLQGGHADAARAQMRMAEADAVGAPERTDRREGRDGPEDVGVLLRLEELRHRYRSGWSGGTQVRALDGVSLEVRAGETLGLIGESGCGKSTLALTAARLLEVDSGRVFFEGRDVTSLRLRQLRHLRRRLQIIFQDPFSSLDPRMTLGSIVMEPLENFGVGDRAGRRSRAAELLDLVGLDASWADRYPYELSGGQRQRIGIARALALDPSLIICDEPVSALDVSIQAQILNLLKDLQESIGLTYLFISHDLAVIRQVADRVAVMYLGRIVEMGDVDTVFERPLHPYTRELLKSLPTLEPHRGGPALPAGARAEPSEPVGTNGCRFQPRCPNSRAPGPCQDDDPHLISHGNEGSLAACHFAGESSVFNRSGATDTL